MRRRSKLLSLMVISAALAVTGSGAGESPLVRHGRAIFRYGTFGDEQLWTGVLRMQEAIAMVDPTTALSVGLKVDVEALPRPLVAALRAGQVDLTNFCA